MLPNPLPHNDAWWELVQLSRRTNDLQRQVQQAQCNQGKTTTNTGSWCLKAVKSLHMTDKPFGAALAELLTGKMVLSLGEGRGDYRALILNTTQVHRHHLLIYNNNNNNNM